MSADGVADGIGKPPAGPADASDEALIGTTVDKRYKLTGLIGRGGMGRVFRAEHVTMRKTFAVKLLSPRTTDPRERARFDREAFATGRTTHPNCVMASDCGTLDDGTRYLAMELLEGDTLAELLDRERRLSVTRTLHIGKHILRGVGHAHGLGVVHRDLKPRNIMLVSHLDDTEFAKVLDFGLAKLIGDVQEEEGGGDLTEVGITFGTPAYMSPEQASGRPVDARADLYAVGVLMFEMLSGRPPFCGTDPQATLLMHVNDLPPRLKDVAPGIDVPTDVELMLRRTLDKNPDERFPDAATFIEHIERHETALADANEPTPPPQREGTAAPKAAPPPEQTPEPVRVSAPAHAHDPAHIPRPAQLKTPAQPSATTVWFGNRRRLITAIAATAATLLVIAIIVLVTGGSSPSDRAQTGDNPALPSTGESVRVRVPELDRAEALLRRGQKHKAAQLLAQLHKRHASNALVPYTQARMYMRWPWPTKAMAAYRVAVSLDPTYRSDAALIDDAIRTLISPSAHKAAARLLVEHVDSAAQPALTRAARDHKNPVIRRRAKEALRRIDEIRP